MQGVRQALGRDAGRVPRRPSRSPRLDSGAQPGTMSVAASLISAAVRWPTRTAVIDLDAPGRPAAATYAQLAWSIQRTADALRELGLQPGDRVAMLMANSREYVDVFCAASLNRIV